MADHNFYTVKASFHSGKQAWNQTGLFSIWYYPHCRTKKIPRLFITQIADHGFQHEQKMATESPCTGTILF